MRLSVFLPETSSQLLIDLQKIYQNYFPADQLTKEALQDLIENEGAQFYATMFNARHLGAVQVIIKDKQAQLRLLTVRDLTRRRGIAKNLLREVEKQLRDEEIDEVIMKLDEIKEEEKEGLTLFMQACGYQFNGEIFSKML